MGSMNLATVRDWATFHDSRTSLRPANHGSRESRVLGFLNPATFHDSRTSLRPVNHGWGDSRVLGSMNPATVRTVRECVTFHDSRTSLRPVIHGWGESHVLGPLNPATVCVCVTFHDFRTSLQSRNIFRCVHWVRVLANQTCLLGPKMHPCILC